MPKTRRDRLVRVQELYDFDERLATRENPVSQRLLLAGFDEAGRGALAGPVVVGCVHFPFISALGWQAALESSMDVRISQSPHPALLSDLAGIDDSKRLTARQREALLPCIKANAAWAIGSASAKEIDELGIVSAVSLAARRAYRAMGLNVDLLLCDRGITTGLARFLLTRGQAAFLHADDKRKDACPPLSLSASDGETRRHGEGENAHPRVPASQRLRVSLSPRPCPSELSFTRGDSRSLHIAAASIVAKVTRDRMMIGLDRRFPGYNFASHKGYGTAAHIAALRKLGPSQIHRCSFHVKSAAGVGIRE